MRDLRCLIFGHSPVPTTEEPVEHGYQTSVATCVNCGMTVGIIAQEEIADD